MKLVALVTASALAATAHVQAQCAQWSTGFARPSLPVVQGFPFSGPDPDVGKPGAGPYVEAFDDGNGTQLFTSGQRFELLQQTHLRRWNGSRWDPALYAPDVYSAAWTCTDQGVPVLLVPTFIGGGMTEIRRWDGTAWTAMPAFTGEVAVMGTFDVGGVPTIFAAGRRLAPLGGFVVAWNGSNWTPFGPDLPKQIGALASYDSGSGAQLYAGSAFGALAAGTAVAKWNGVSWEGVGFELTVRDLRTVNGELFAASATLDKLVAGAWVPVDASLGDALALEEADFGAGPRLVAAFRAGVGVYDGTQISLIGNFRFASTTPSAVSMTFAPAPGGGRLYVSGSFIGVDDVGCLGLASTDGTSWSTLGRGFDATVGVLVRHETGSGERLFAAGEFTHAGHATTAPVTASTWYPELQSCAEWDGSDWLATGTTLTNPRWAFTALRSIDLGSGAELYGGGTRVLGSDMLGVARWTGSTWTAVAPAIGGSVYALGSFDDGSGPRLVAGGNFGPPSGNSIARLVGGTWTPLGAGANGDVVVLETFDDGNGPRLFAGGGFTTIGGLASGGIGAWDGASWSTLGSGITGGVNSLCTFNDGNGPQLYVGGTLTNAGGVVVQHLARWDGVSWSNLPGGGPNGNAAALCVHDDGRGPALYVGGGFNSIGGITAYNLARFDGTSWETVDGGVDGVVRALASVDDDGDGDRELFVGGRFHQTATIASSNIARLEGCPHYTSFCAGDGQYLDHTTPCPCGNDGAAGRGCASSFVADGALLEASGSTANDTLVLHVIDTPQSSLGIYLQHDAQDDRVFHDGVLCASGNLIRLRRHFSVGGESMFPDSTDTTTVAQRGSVTPGSGATRFYSCFYRNASTTFCPPATANVSNGIRVIW